MIYVDPMKNRGWGYHGRDIQSCHLFTDGELDELHNFAIEIGMKISWFQTHNSVPHYDLTPSRRKSAVENGAKEVSQREAVEIWKKIKDKIHV